MERLTCLAFEADLAELVERGGAPAESGALARHLSGCPACAGGLAEAREGFEALELPGLQTPAFAADAVLDLVHRDLRASRLAPARRPTLPSDVIMAAAFGMAAALASTLILARRVNLDAHTPLAIAAGAILWTGAFIAAFWLVLRKGTEARSMRDLALCGLGAMALFLAIDQVLPLTQVVAYCRMDSWGRRLLGPVGIKGLFFLIGAGYAMVPIFLLSLATGSRQRAGQVRDALVAGSLFFFLLAPAIFLQCRSFTVGALASWLGGSVLGALAGSAAGHWIRKNGRAALA